MNRKQREKNRRTARELNSEVRYKESMKHTCEECGEPGYHWVGMPMSLEDILFQREPQGFWTCAKFYGADGRRIL